MAQTAPVPAPLIKPPSSRSGLLPPPKSSKTPKRFSPISVTRPLISACIHSFSNPITTPSSSPMEAANVTRVEHVALARRGYCIEGTLLLLPHHLVFSFSAPPGDDGKQLPPREIWICYPVIERILKARGSLWISGSAKNGPPADLRSLTSDKFDHYSASHIRVHCKDFTFYLFDFPNDLVCTDVYVRMSALLTAPRARNSIKELYAFHYRPNALEKGLESSGWGLFDPEKEYTRQGLIGAGAGENDASSNVSWRVSRVNEDYKFCPSYPRLLVVPNCISDNVLKHAAKFRSKLRIPAVVYRHRNGPNGNVIARCAQPLVGLNLQNRSIQDEKLIGEIFRTQEHERAALLALQEGDDALRAQPQRNLIVDLRPITNAMAQHALGAGTENIDNYRGREPKTDKSTLDNSTKPSPSQQVDKIFCNIDNIHVMRDLINKLTTVLNELDRFPVASSGQQLLYPLLQQSLTKTQWLHRLLIILQSVDRITKSVHLNNTNVIIHCLDGWDRTSQVLALLQLCLDPYFRTMEGFMVLVEKEWVSFGFKFNTRADHGGCIGATMPKPPQPQPENGSQQSLEASDIIEGGKKSVASFLLRAANHVKNAASAATSSSPTGSDTDGEGGQFSGGSSVYSGSSEKLPVFHQFVDCVFQLYRQHPTEFGFNSRFLKRLFYHYYLCQYGTFLCDTERETRDVKGATVSVWDYFNSRKTEFANLAFVASDNVLSFNYTDVKWWYELYGRSDEEMNGLLNSLDRKFAQMKLHSLPTSVPAPEPA